MKLIAGLGNPGQSYIKTRHNIGFLTIDRLAEKYDISLDREKYNSFFGETHISGEKVILLKPLTFMNLSGEAVGACVRRLKLRFEDLFVVCDDVNLDFGVLRMRQKGSAGGHHGLESIIRHLSSNEFPRLRVGIGGGSMSELAGYVLEPFTKHEKQALDEVLNNASDAVDIWLRQGITKAMNKYNVKKKGQEK